MAYFELYKCKWLLVLVKLDLDVVAAVDVEDLMASYFELLLGELVRETGKMLRHGR